MLRIFLALASLFICFMTTANAATLKLTQQTIDPKTGKAILTPVELDPAKTAVVLIDTWNQHWCMTASERVAALFPRMNHSLAVLRDLGVQIVWNPTDVVTMYAGMPQYERSVVVDRRKAPHVREVPPVKFTAPGGGCICGPGIQCRGHYGWDNMGPELIIGKNDLFSASDDELYSLLTDRGITHIIYMGVHTNMCVFGKPGALGPMWRSGFECMLARDINDALTSYFPDKNYTPDMGTDEINRNLQESGVPVVNIVDGLKEAGLWKYGGPIDYVRIAPWGKPDRPYIFEKSFTVTLMPRWMEDAEVRYTLDGSEPTTTSTLYTTPFVVSESLTLKAAAFRNGKQVSLPSMAYYVKMTGGIPPKPDVYLEDLEYIPNQYVKSGYTNCQWFPAAGKSFEGDTLRVRGELYEHGLGCRAPTTFQYELKPEYKRFVARAGIDENILIGAENDFGRFTAIHSSVVFRLFIDGEMVAESPVMRITQEPWRFDVPIPEGSRLISLACMDAGTRNVLDYGNWLDAGFITR